MSKNNEKREIIILDCKEIKCPLVLTFVFSELCGYFRRNDYIVKIVNNIEEITNNSIVFMGDIFNCENPSNLLNTYAPEAIYIGWYWQKIDTSSLKYFIYIYENFLNIYYDNSRLNDLIFLRNTNNNTPLLLRADEDPKLIGSYKRNNVLDYCYMGSRYCPHLIPSNKFKGIYHGVYDHKQFLSYDKRREIYLSSIFALGFQIEQNIGHKHISQRIYEGLAYGCIVLSNSLPACEQTNNIVVFIESLQDLENKMTFYKNNPELIKNKQLEGYEFIKKYGTNEFSVEQITNVIKNNFDIII